jgi:transposase InsO family protein
MAYQPIRSNEDDLRARILELARERPRYGYRRIHVLLRREGFRDNRKRTYRIYREEKLAVRRRRRKREAVAIEVGKSIPGSPVVRVLD